MKKIAVSISFATIAFFAGIYVGSHSTETSPGNKPLSLQERLDSNGSLIWVKSADPEGLGLWQNASEGYHTSGCLILVYDDYKQAKSAAEHGLIPPYRRSWVDVDKLTGQGVYLEAVEGLDSECSKIVFKTFDWPQP